MYPPTQALFFFAGQFISFIPRSLSQSPSRASNPGEYKAKGQIFTSVGFETYDCPDDLRFTVPLKCCALERLRVFIYHDKSPFTSFKVY